MEPEARPLVSLNAPAPQFEASSTHGPLKLSDYKGKWVLLFSHPADFTPVCTTEFIEFAKRAKEFEDRNVQLIGLSIDSIYAHLGWTQNIHKNFGIKVPFPVIADLNMNVAILYGMIHPGASETATVRCVFFIDPKQVVRAMIYYPLTNGRSIDEVLRVIDALQTSDANQVATPANWKKGEKVIIPPPQSQAALAERLLTEGIELVDWYFSKKKLQ